MILNIILIGLYYLLRIYYFIMFVGIILSWIPGAMKISFFRGIRKMTDWYLGIFRGYLVVGIFDFSSLIGILLYEGILNLFVIAFLR